MDAGFPSRLVESALTLYMILILIRWVGSYLEIELHARPWHWIPRLTDPLLNWLRRVLPPMGPLDFGPIAAFMLVWIVRVFVAEVLLSPHVPG